MNIKLFFQAIETSDVNALQEQMRCDDFDINCFAGRYRFSALHSAATKGDPIIVKFLLDVGDQYGLNVDSKNIDGVTPLYSAVMRACRADEVEYIRYLEIIALLLNAGANCEERNNEGITALRHAEVRDKRKRVFNLLRVNSKSESQQSIERPNENEPPLHPENPDFISSASSQARANSIAQAEKKPVSGLLESIYGWFPFSNAKPKATSGSESSPLLPKLKKE